MKSTRSTQAEEKWKKVFEDWARSDLNVRKFCKSKKIAPSNFYKWKRKMNVSIPANYKAINDHQKWWEICEEWAKSGLSARKFYQKKNIAKSKFTYWREKIDFPFLKRPRKITLNWDEIINDWENSGLNIKTYCEEKNISVKSLCKKRYKIAHPSYVSKKDTAHKWQKIIKDWEASGLSVGAYALEHQLNPNSLRHWDRKCNPHKLRKTDKALQKWTKIMEDWQTTGWQGGTYCRRNGIETSCFYKWQKRLNVSDPSKPPLNFTRQDVPEICLEDYFISIPLSSALSMGSPASSRKREVILPQGHQLSIEDLCDEEKT